MHYVYLVSSKCNDQVRRFGRLDLASKLSRLKKEVL